MAIQDLELMKTRGLLNSFPLGLLIYSKDGDLTYLNPQAQALLGHHTLEALTLDTFSRTINLYLQESDRLYPAEWLPAVQALQGHQVRRCDLELRWGDRTIILQADAAPHRHPDGHITHAVVTLQEITDHAPQMHRPVVTDALSPRYPGACYTLEYQREMLIRQHIETELLQNQIRFQRVSAAVPGVVYSLLAEGSHLRAFEYVNQRVIQLYEMPFEVILQSPQSAVLAQMHPRDRSSFLTELTRCAAQQSTFSHEWRSCSPSGVQRWLHTYAQPEIRESGQVCWHGLLFDITKQKTTELQLQEKVVQSRAMLSAIPDLIIHVDRSGYYLDCVRDHPEVNILSQDQDITAYHMSDCLPPDVAIKQLEAIQTTLATGELQIFEQTLTVRGRVQHEEIRMVPYDADTVLMIIRNISNRKAAEQALKHSEAEHRAVVNALPDLMFRVDGDGYWLGYVRTNASIDYLPQDYDPIGHHISEYMPKDMAEQKLASIRQALHTGEVQVTEQQLKIGDHRQYEEVRIVPQAHHEVLFIVRDITDRKETELALRRSEAQKRAMLSAIPDLMFQLQRDGTFLNYFKHENARDFIPKTTNPVGYKLTDFAAGNEAHQKHVEKQLQAVHQALTLNDIIIYEQVIHCDDEIHYEEIRVVPSGEDEVLMIIQDISDRKQAEIALQTSEAQKQAILTAIPDLMFRMRQDGLILDYLTGSNFNDLLVKDYSEGQVAGHRLTDYATTKEMSAHIQQKMQAMHQALVTGEIQIYEQETIISGQMQHEEVRITPINPTEVLVMIRDISDRKRMEAELRSANERLAKLSLTDPLTMVANRRSLDEHFSREWQRAIREQQPMSFILFDVDYFKRFNDTYGHQLGDDCLLQVAQAAASTVNRSSDLVARYGGEEFAVVLTNTNLKGAFSIAQRIHGRIMALKIPHQSSDVSDSVTVSLGVSSLIPRPETQPNMLIRQADQALYSAKQAGRNNCQCFISR